MSFVLTKNGTQIAVSGGWNPAMFGKMTGTSFPADVLLDYTWTNEEFDLRWQDDVAAVPNPNDAIRNQIAELEDTVTNRRMREALLTDTGAAWLSAVEEQIAALRAQLT
jgi:hypothetical protein